MRICGLKLTHDSTIALVEDGKLVFSIELEKMNNNNRFKIFEDLQDVEAILLQNGVTLEQIDVFVVDGWIGNTQGTIKSMNQSNPVQLTVAPYMEIDSSENILAAYRSHMEIGNKGIGYKSYMHVVGHIFSAYSTSPFAKNAESSFVLIWDGGMPPKLYYLNAGERKIECLGELFFLGVNIYSIFTQFFSPFKINDNVIKDELSIAGKVMAYAAFGKISEAIIRDMEAVYELVLREAQNGVNIPDLPYEYAKLFRIRVRDKNYFDDDVIASFHEFLQRKIVRELEKRTNTVPHAKINLCLAGGAALNIKWNSAIREKRIFKNTWVCPFPNDAGSAIGMAACEHFIQTGRFHLDWDVYKGPELILNEPVAGWNKRPCSVEELASLIHESDEPVVFLQGRAELGPRALGNRSILASAKSVKMKDKLNYIKIREPYRPVAPVCLEEDALEIFEPGYTDPYMLFDHKIRGEWTHKVPAITHKDNTARLQTVSELSNANLYKLLVAYKKISGIPLLCNTSANYKGCGFFPDIFNATRWNKVNYVWANETLYEKNEKLVGL